MSEKSKKMKKVVILRGVPGSGKSSLYPEGCMVKDEGDPSGKNRCMNVIVSADDFFLSEAPDLDYGDGYGDIKPPFPIVTKKEDFKTKKYFYKFDPTKMGEAHNWCFVQFIKALGKNAPHIVVDNTNIHVWEFEKYIELAKVMGYDVEVKTFKPITIEEIKLCNERNSHEVPIEVIMKMALEFEDYESEEILEIEKGERKEKKDP